jgi:hypothetical protein
MASASTAQAGPPYLSSLHHQLGKSVALQRGYLRIG